MKARLAIQPSDFAYALRAFKWLYRKPVASRAMPARIYAMGKAKPAGHRPSGQRKARRNGRA